MKIEKLDMKTPDITDENVARIAELFPNVVTEGKDENGKLTYVVDFDALKQELSDSIVEGPQERYRLDWPGKREAMLAANTPITKTLRPVREESVEFDTTKNLFIEGDNLDALKLLQETYLGKVKMIYIDPPYNTGKDFIYKDNFTADKTEYMEDSGQIDETGGRLVANPDSHGRYHSDWLSMMYPRLKLARNLLRDDGLIFISIGQEELANLRSIMNHVFGESNYRNTIAIKRGAKSVQAQFDTWDKLGSAFEYVLLYSTNASFRFPKMLRKLDKPKCGAWNNHWRGTDRPTMRYEIFGISPDTGQWRWGQERSIAAIDNYNRMLSEMQLRPCDISQDKIDNWYTQQSDKPDLLRLSSNRKPEHYIPATDVTLLNDMWFHVPANGSRIVKKLFDKNPFDNPKPMDLLKQCINFVDDDALILDFFAGSATTAHATMQLNAQDGTTRKFIMMQLPESTNEKSDARKEGYTTIADLSKERIRRAGTKILEDNPDQVGKLDIGFRVLKIDSSNMNDVYYAPGDVDQTSLLDTVEHIKPDRSAEDLLFQVMLDWGVDLSLPIVRETVDGKTVFFVGENDLAACFDMKITEELVKEMAARKPLRAVFRDDGFGSDSKAGDDMKINAGQLFTQMTDGHTDMKVI